LQSNEKAFKLFHLFCSLLDNKQVMKPIVIIGAGMAGLQAASQFAQQKIPFLLLDSDTRAGGRIKSDPVDGFILDHGFQVLQTNYSEVQVSLDLEALNLSSFDSGSQLWISGRWRNFLNPLRHGFQLLSLVPSVITFKDLILLARLWVVLKWQGDASHSSNESTAELLQRWGFSTPFRAQFIEPFFRGIFLDEQLGQPASLFFFFMRQFLEGQAALPAEGIGEIPKQMLQTLPSGSVRLGSEVVQIDSKQLTLQNGETIDFDRLIVALDPHAAAKLLHVDLPDSVHLGCKTFYFAAPARTEQDRLLHLMPPGNKLMHYCFLSHVAKSYAPAGKDLIQVTSLDLNLEPTEVIQLMKEYESVEDITFLKAYTLPRSLAKSGVFDALKAAAQAKGFILAGDYCEMPSLQGALVSGKKDAAYSLVY
jgi:hypothetical protein